MMVENQSVWQPKFTITPKIASCLMEIEAARAVVEHVPLPPAVEAELRMRARIRATHYSTQIEGNRLTFEQAAQVIQEPGVEIRGRECDVREVRKYWNAWRVICWWNGFKMAGWSLLTHPGAGAGTVYR
jgi:Fic family protein